jgi:DNA processing protein
MLKHTQSVVKELSYCVIPVTGVADGGDSAAIEGALQGSGKVICVLAGGFGAIPQTNIALLERVVKHGLLLALHEYQTPVRNFSFEYRNKFLAALANGVFVTGAGEKSGALITAKYAKKAGKPIFAFPYPPNAYGGVGCNALLKSGGVLIETAEDIFAFFGIEKRIEKKEVSLSETEQKLFTALRALGEGHASEIAKNAGVPLFKACAALSALEVKGLILSIGANRYTLV